MNIYSDKWIDLESKKGNSYYRTFHKETLFKSRCRGKSYQDKQDCEECNNTGSDQSKGCYL